MTILNLCTVLLSPIFHLSISSCQKWKMEIIRLELLHLSPTKKTKLPIQESIPSSSSVTTEKVYPLPSKCSESHPFLLFQETCSINCSFLFLISSVSHLLLSWIFPIHLKSLVSAILKKKKVPHDIMFTFQLSSVFSFLTNCSLLLLLH